MSTWQPIETAPKDRLILICSKFESRLIIEVAIWTETKKRMGFSGFVAQFSGPVEPTHWMPLPEPPR